MIQQNSPRRRVVFPGEIGEALAGAERAGGWDALRMFRWGFPWKIHGKYQWKVSLCYKISCGW